MLRVMLRPLARFVPLRGDRRVHVVLSAASAAVILLGAVVALISCTNGATPVCDGGAGCGPNLDGAVLDGVFGDVTDSGPPFDSSSDVVVDVVVDAPSDVHVDVAPDA